MPSNGKGSIKLGEFIKKRREKLGLSQTDLAKRYKCVPSYICRFEKGDYHVDYRLGIIRVMGKGGKERLMRISDKTRQTLWKYLLIRDIKAPASQERLFLGEEMRPLTRRGLTTIIYKLGQKAGLSGVRCSPHTFRHTFAVSFLRAGGNIRDLQSLGGWADIQSLIRYTSSLTSEDALRAHEKFSPVDRML